MTPDRSGLRPYLVPLALVFGAHVLWLFICGGFRVVSEILSYFLP